MHGRLGVEIFLAGSMNTENIQIWMCLLVIASMIWIGEVENV